MPPMTIDCVTRHQPCPEAIPDRVESTANVDTQTHDLAKSVRSVQSLTMSDASDVKVIGSSD